MPTRLTPQAACLHLVLFCYPTGSICCCGAEPCSSNHCRDQQGCKHRQQQPGKFPSVSWFALLKRGTGLPIVPVASMLACVCLIYKHTCCIGEMCCHLPSQHGQTHSCSTLLLMQPRALQRYTCLCKPSDKSAVIPPSSSSFHRRRLLAITRITTPYYYTSYYWGWGYSGTMGFSLFVGLAGA